VALKAAEKLKKDLKELKLITCHLGAGCSITAIKNGQAIDTSMGMTPLEGLVMQTRAGDTDLGIIMNKMQEMLALKTSSEISVIETMNNILNRESGFAGLGGVKNYLELLKQAQLGEKRAKLALDLFIYRIQKYIGAYFAILGGCDALILTGAIGAGNPTTKKKIIQDLKVLNKTEVLAMPTDEEWMIAEDVRNFLRLG
jgi:acetate kinase